MGVVGWGSGATAGYSLLFPIHKLVCAEIESAVLDTSSFFHSINLAPERDSRLHVKINDGRNYLMTTDELFDVIASEPSNPWQAGVSNLFTREYFQICHDRLRSGGLFSLWCQYVELSTDDLCRILSALKHVFKHVIIFSTGTDMVIVSSDTPIKIKLPAVAAALQSARMKEALAQTAGISQPEDLPAYIAMAEDGVDRAVEGQPPCTDDRNYIEFDVAKNYEQHNYSQANTNWLTQNAGSLWKTIDWGSLPDKDKAETMNMIAESALAHNIPNAELWAYQSAKLFSTSHAWQIIAMIEAEKNGNFTRALQAARQAVEQFPQDKQAHCMKGLIELMGGAPMSARRDFQTALRLSPNEKIYKYRLAQTYLPQYRPWYQLSKTPFKDSATAGSDPQKALELLSPLVEDKNFLSEHPAIMPLLAAARLQLGDTTSGIVLMQVYLQTQPDDKLARQLLEAALSARASAKETEHRSIKRQAQISK